MEKTLLNLEKPIKTNPTDQKPHKSNRFSISAFVFFIFICFFLVHFHPSPSKLFHNTKFWFFLSNALILIIAADSGAFSSSKQKYDLYEEYLLNSRTRINASSLIHGDQTSITPTIAASFVKEMPPENVAEKSVVIHTEREKLPESLPEDVPCKSDNSESLEENTSETSRDEETQVEDDACETKEIRESNLEENEFSAMSDEELNRRVEEFIRFNRQMRLQETRRLVLVGDI